MMGRSLNSQSHNGIVLDFKAGAVIMVLLIMEHIEDKVTDRLELCTQLLFNCTTTLNLSIWSISDAKTSSVACDQALGFPPATSQQH